MIRRRSDCLNWMLKLMNRMLKLSRDHVCQPLPPFFWERAAGTVRGVNQFPVWYQGVGRSDKNNV